MAVRIATYNVHKCRGIDWRLSLGRIARVIDELDTAVVGLQEVFAEQAESLARHLGMKCVFGKARELAGNPYGNAILAKHEPVASHNFDLTVAGREPRSCLRVDFSLPGIGNLHFFNAHLGTSFFERRVQAARIVSPGVLGTPDVVYPRVLVGDFNEWTRGKVSRTLAKYMCSADLGEHLAWRRTYPGTLPFLHLDHVYHDRALKLTHMRVHRSAASLVASDHLPLVSTLERADRQAEMLTAPEWTTTHSN